MKTILALLIALLSSGHLKAAEEEVLSTSPDGAFELVLITEELPVKDKTQEQEQRRELAARVLRNTKTKAAVVPDASGDAEDLIDGGGGIPTLQWSPKDNRLLIISAQVYKHYGESKGVFRITADSRLVEVPMPLDAIPDRWKPDGTLILLVKHEDVYRFDAAKGKLVPVPDAKKGK